MIFRTENTHQYKPGQKVRVLVGRVADYGLIVELLPDEYANIKLLSGEHKGETLEFDLTRSILADAPIENPQHGISLRGRWTPPQKVYALGFLREIELEGGKVMIFKGNRIIVASNSNNRQLYLFHSDTRSRKVGYTEGMRGIGNLASSYSAFHWGDKPDALFIAKHAVPSGGIVYPKGKIVRIDYAAVKNGERCEYTHDHKPPFPTLAMDSTGQQLFYLGGKYTIEGRGIVR